MGGNPGGKEKYHTMVVNCHHSLRLCGGRMKKSLPKNLGLSFGDDDIVAHVCLISFPTLLDNRGF